MKDLEHKTDSFVLRDRTNYQLKHFVIGQHDSPQMQYKQILIEAQSLLMRIRQTELGIEITRLKIAHLEESEKQKKQLKAKKLKLDLALTSRVLEGAKQELAYLYELSKNYPDYSNDDIEADQENYWQLRLTRQAENDRISIEQGISSGNVEAMRQAKLWQKELTQ